MPPRKPREEPVVTATVKVGLWEDLAKLHVRIKAALETEADYNRKVALTKINAALDYGLDLAGR